MARDHPDSQSDFKRITARDMWAFIVHSEWYFVERDDLDSTEYIFDIEYSANASNVDQRVVIRWYTTVDRHKEIAKPYGEATMKVCLLHDQTEKQIFDCNRVYRIETWQDNLSGKIRAYEDQLTALPSCPTCNHLLVQEPDVDGTIRTCTGESCDYLEVGADN